MPAQAQQQSSNGVSASFISSAKFFHKKKRRSARVVPKNGEREQTTLGLPMDVTGILWGQQLPVTLKVAPWHESGSLAGNCCGGQFIDIL